MTKNKQLTVINHHLCHAHASFWLGDRTVFYSTPVSCTRRTRSQIGMTHASETGAGKMERIFGVGL